MTKVRIGQAEIRVQLFDGSEIDVSGKLTTGGVTVSHERQSVNFSPSNGPDFSVPVSTKTICRFTLIGTFPELESLCRQGKNVSIFGGRESMEGEILEYKLSSSGGSMALAEFEMQSGVYLNETEEERTVRLVKRRLFATVGRSD